jgi:hypothetical protein
VGMLLLEVAGDVLARGSHFVVQLINKAFNTVAAVV